MRHRYHPKKKLTKLEFSDGKILTVKMKPSVKRVLDHLIDQVQRGKAPADKLLSFLTIGLKKGYIETVSVMDELGKEVMNILEDQSNDK